MAEHIPSELSCTLDGEQIVTFSAEITSASAFEYIQILVSNGFSVEAIQEGKRWRIEGRKQCQS